MSNLRIFILSDLHAFDKDSISAPPAHGGGSMRPPVFPSIYDVEDDKNPAKVLLDHVEKNRVRADVLICCGDLADKAHPRIAKAVWRFLQELKDKLQAQYLLPTTGNHDLDSRYIHNDHDARGHLVCLEPPYPTPDEIVNLKFWTYHFYHVRKDWLDFIVLNTAAHHGVKDEFEHGRVAPKTFERLGLYLEELQRNSSQPLNGIIVSHHHLATLAEHGLGTSDDTAGAYNLLQRIGDGTLGRWMVVHGHKHLPKLTYAQGSSSAPVLFSAGSFSATLEHRVPAQNQYYIVEVDKRNVDRYGLVGLVHAWDWVPMVGWCEATSRSGLPNRSGFGLRRDPTSLAQQIAAGLSPGETIVDDAVYARFPELQFLMPCELQVLFGKYLPAHGVNSRYIERTGAIAIQT